MTPPVLPGAEPWSHDGGSAGALCIHGFTGNPGSMRGVAEAFAAAGFSVELPRLPGHGTTLDEMLTTTWEDWTSEVEAAYQRLASRTDRIVAAGLSMGGSLALWTGQRHPEVAGVVCINPATQPFGDDVVAVVRAMLEEGTEVMPGIGSDIADPDVTESAYDGTPIRPLLSMLDGLAELVAGYPAMSMPLLLLTSAQDHVVEPSHSDALAASYGGPIERLTLERSYHVATLDYDKELILERAVAFAQKVTGTG